MLTSFKKYQGNKFENGKSSKVEDFISIEVPLKITINKEPFTVTMCTPGDEMDLAIGLLFSENIIKDFTNITFQNSEDLSINVSVPESELKNGYLNARNFLSISSCGVCGKTDLPEVTGSLTEDFQVGYLNVFSGYEKMRKQQTNFNKTGGCHASGILDEKGHLLVVREDIGRHNAVDKAIGHLIRKSELLKAKTMLVSGRISYEIVIKTYRAKIPTLVAVSAPSSLAIDYAKELGISLFAFCRDYKLTQYS